ncbi:MAG TPA: hypothetical protein PK636_02490, partial [bacterium]|nr:hypothetical protein [bacterium]
MGTAWKTLAHLVLIAAVGFLVYLPALDASFHLDDSPSIRDNQAIRNLKVVPLWNFWPTRFLNYLSLAANYRAGGLSPRGYHAVNVAVHLLNALLLYGVLRLLFPGRTVPPLAGALLFVLHPLQTQAVTYVVQRATSLASGFCLLSVFLYLRSRFRPGRS